jgi:hypothetical protein
MTTRNITSADLFLIIKDIGSGVTVIRAADSEGIAINGYLNLSHMADRLNALIELRMRSERELHDTQAR